MGGKLAFIGIKLDADTARFARQSVLAAGERHFGDGDEKAAVGAIVHGEDATFADQRADQAACLDLGIEIDRRGRSIEFSGRVVLI